jgi:hypothetical protein
MIASHEYSFSEKELQGINPKVGDNSVALGSAVLEAAEYALANIE